MLSRNNRGQVVRVHAYTTPMRKHGGDVQARKPIELTILDSIVASPVSYGPTVRVRKLSPARPARPARPGYLD